ncbi:ribonuclease HI [Magnetofaba australis]|uniref:Ribonuclease H n=1 Tax=Magnetofaba australis IT-1 TaxID=1434232 RepID=A0A1Y2K969_9PROT|nr:ribonuclease HI [Magnetofaba australis]OSM05226.1 putative RNase HI [Magnetofaba australis IT-1]
MASLDDTPSLFSNLEADEPEASGCLSTTIIHTDGACSGNPGPGGWGYVWERDGLAGQAAGFSPRTTNNRMELLAAIRALESLPRGSQAEVITDSAYVKNGITEWIHGWKRRNWRKSGGGAVLNADLWKRLDALAAQRSVEWRWIKGHAGHPGNEAADALARRAISDGLNGLADADPEGAL